MNTGELIRRYRKLAGLSQAKLGEAASLSEPAIRNYELGNRTPGPEQLSAIAKALDIDTSALVSYELNSSRDVLGVLFQLGNEFGLKPTKDGTLTIDPSAPSAPKIVQAIKAWKEMEDKAEARDISEDELVEWKAKLKIS